MQKSHFSSFQVALLVALAALNVVILLSMTTPAPAQPEPKSAAPQAFGNRVYLPLVNTTGKIAYVDNLSAYTEAATPEILHILGEVVNNTGKPIHQITVTVGLYAKDNPTPIATIHAQPFKGIVPTSQAACFNFAIPKPANYHHFAVQNLTHQVFSGTLPNLTISSVQGGFDEDFDWYQINGTVNNPAGTLLKEARVVGTLYNAYHTVVGCDQTYASFPEENPFTSGSFTLYYLDKLYANVMSFQLQVIGSTP